jgi:SsrA-binding protein
MYFKNGKAKVLLGLGKGKAKYDKRRTIQKRDQDREMQRVWKKP